MTLAARHRSHQRPVRGARIGAAYLPDRGLLEAAGLTVSEEEFQTFVRMYPNIRKGADSLYIEETRYEEPSLIFSVKP